MRRHFSVEKLNCTFALDVVLKTIHVHMSFWNEVLFKDNFVVTLFNGQELLRLCIY